MARSTDNRFDEDLLISTVQEIEKTNAELDKAIKDLKTKAKNHIAVLTEEASDGGIPKALLRKSLQKRKLEQKIDDLEDSVSDEYRAVYDDMQEALGALYDTPLGQAADAQNEKNRAEQEKGFDFDHDGEQQAGEDVLNRTAH